MEAIRYSVHEYGVKVPTEQLKVDLTVQRATIMARVAKLASHWDESLVGELLVFKRGDGFYYVGDGGHRLAAARKRGEPTMMCEAFEGVSLQDESRVFIGRNDRAGISQVDRIRNLYTQADEVTNTIHNAAQSAGLVFVANRREDVTFRAVGDAKAILNAAQRKDRGGNGGHHLADMLQFYVTCWGKKDEVNGTLLKALSKMFLKRATLDRDTFAMELSRVPAEQVTEMARVTYNGIKATGQPISLTTAATRVLIDIYNTDRRGRSRLGKV